MNATNERITGLFVVAAAAIAFLELLAIWFGLVWLVEKTGTLLRDFYYAGANRFCLSTIAAEDVRKEEDDESNREELAAEVAAAEEMFDIEEAEEDALARRIGMNFAFKWFWDRKKKQKEKEEEGKIKEVEEKEEDVVEEGWERLEQVEYEEQE